MYSILDILSQFHTITARVGAFYSFFTQAIPMQIKKILPIAIVLSLLTTQIYANEGGKIMAGFYTWMMIFMVIGALIILWLIILIIKSFRKK